MIKAKHPNIADELQDRIIRGEYEFKLPGINVLAEEYSVNNRTMIKAIETLENKGCVKRIPSKGTFVTRLRHQRTNLIGVVMGASGAAAPLHLKIINGINSVAQGEGKSILLGQEHHNHLDVELETTRDLVEKRLVDGIVIWPSYNDRKPSPAINYLIEQKIPFVVVPEQDQELFSHCYMVTNNDSSGFEQLVEHLIQVGHRKIAYVVDGPFDDAVYKQHRYKQYKKAMANAGLEISEPIIIPCPFNQEQQPFSMELISRLREFEAAACSRDLVGMILMRECLRNGIRVPTDLAVAGYDNSQESAIMELTTVEQHLEQIGEKAAQLLLEEIEGKRAKPVIINVNSELIIRRSSRRAKQS